ncbi:MAG: TSUP family transporter [Saprospiraceae bacterium]|nr:TSUP family transporter [Saprospiraceae bacterium]MDZ4705100.1 TSUP family transporter [Saprospiraceae bacterium]
MARISTTEPPTEAFSSKSGPHSGDDSPGNTLFPIFLKLEKFRVLIIGGGYVGLEKIRAVLNNSPQTRITLVGVHISQAIRDYARDYPQVILVEKPFESGDLAGQQFAIAATDDRVLNEQIRDLATERGILCNVADTPELCDFYLSSIVQKGDLKIAISTNGKSPTIAKRLKETFQEALPDELDQVLQKMPVIRQRLKGDFSEKVNALSELTAVLVAEPAMAVRDVLRQRNLNKVDGEKWRRIATASLVAFALLLLTNILAVYVPGESWDALTLHLDATFWLFVATGFAAQFVDGLLGMGYGVVTQIVLMGTGVPLAAISSSIHTAEMFSAGASGYSHYRFGNVNRKLFKVLLIPGVLGAIAGAALLSWLGNEYASLIRPMLAVYAMILGLRILSRAFAQNQKRRKVKNMGWLAGAGGFLDSFGGGGWGPLVTSTLIAKGKTPQYVIGTVSLTEFFITFASALTFFSLIGIEHWKVIAGLILGGVVAAPFAARLAGKLPVRLLFIGVGIMVIFWSLRILWKVF